MGKRVMIVDDAPFMRVMIANALRPKGYEIVAEATDGDEAVALHREMKPDVTTLDIVMQRMSGIEALREIRKEDPSARIVMVSAIDQRDALMEAIRLGAADFVVKPFDAERIVSAVTRALG